jgi:transcriptional regulator with XRE-family HTH domain
MTKCQACGALGGEKKLLSAHEDTLIGAPFAIVLENVVTEELCAACGARKGLDYRNLAGLIAAVAMARAVYPDKLWPEEIRFLRKTMGWKQAQLAKKMQKSAETVSRWENGSLAMAPDVEKHFRLHVCFSLWEDAPLVHFDPDKMLDLQIRSARAIDSELVIHCWPAHPSECATPQKWDANIRNKAA